MLVNSPMTLLIAECSPVIVHVTWVPVPSGRSANTVVLRDLNGFSNSTVMRTLDGAMASTISILPWPTLRLPDQAYAAPGPDSAPLNVRVCVGSRSSHGDQSIHL